LKSPEESQTKEWLNIEKAISEKKIQSVKDVEKYYLVGAAEAAKLETYFKK